MKKILGILLMIALSGVLFSCGYALETASPIKGNLSSDTFTIGENSENTLNQDSGDSPADIESEDIGSAVPPTEKPILDKEQGKITYVQALTNSLNVRTKPSLKGSITGSINKNDRVLYLGIENGWYKTYYKNAVAYVSSNSLFTQLVQMNSAEEKIERVIEIGTKYLGTPYVYGAVRLHGGSGVMLKNFTDKKFDCSSYTQFMFYYGASYNLDVTTRTQVKQGVKVSTLQRGDLMFFTNASRRYNTGIERIGHVAVYLGDNYILHTASDYAVIEPISATRWNYFIEGRMVI